MTFAELRLAEPLLRALATEGYTTPTPIQAKAIPHVLAGSDLLGCAQTGTGKTAAFALPTLQRLMVAPVAAAHAAPTPPAHGSHAPRTPSAPQHGSHASHASRGGHGGHAAHGHRATRPIRALILAPTRELAAQIGDSFRAYGRNTGLRHTTIFGGVGQNPQVHALRAGIDILIATPGRLMDLMNQGFIHLKQVEVFILDEADRMLDMGFIPDIRRIVSHLPATGKRQTLMFSATMPPEVRDLTHDLLHQPVNVQVAPASATADRIQQSVFFVDQRNKSELLVHLLEKESFTRALVFTRTKHGADRVARHLFRAGIQAEAIHGNKSQNARQRALENFRSGKTPVLIASDIAARGIDIDEISHVVNYDMPNVPETYVHRIGRTARAGASGVAISFCDHSERSHLKAIERLTKATVGVRDDQPRYTQQSAPRSDVREGHRQGAGHRGHGGHGAHGGQRGHSGQSTHTSERGGPQGHRHQGGHHGQAAPRPSPAPAGHVDQRSHETSAAHPRRDSHPRRDGHAQGGKSGYQRWRGKTG